MRATYIILLITGIGLLIFQSFVVLALLSGDYEIRNTESFTTSHFVGLWIGRFLFLIVSVPVFAIAFWIRKALKRRKTKSQIDQFLQ